MVQDTIWFWVIISLAGLLSVMVAIVLVFMNKDTNRFYALRAFSIGLCSGYLLGLSGFLLPLGRLAGLHPFVALTYAFVILLLCIYLFFNPAVLYGNSISGNPVQAVALDIPQVHRQDGSSVHEKTELPVKNDEKEENKKEVFTEAASLPAAKAGLTIEQSLKYQKMIRSHFVETRAFCKPKYAIRDLSNETGIPGYLVSLFVNQEYGMNFNEFVNAYRVEYLAGLLKTSFNCEAYTLEAMGKMAGFNSRTAFIAAIKKYTGMTPSAFFGRRDKEAMEFSILNFPEKMRDVA